MKVCAVEWTALVLFSLSVGAQPQPGKDGIYRVGNGVSSPVPIYKPDPRYSEEARKVKFQGTEMLAVVIDENGSVRDVQVKRPLGLGLDEKAVESVSTWRFQPAMKDGEPVPVMANVEVSFRLLLSGWSVGGLLFEMPAGTSLPVFVKPHFVAPKSATDGEVRVLTAVDEEGRAKVVRVISPANPELDDSAVESVEGSRFRPAMKEGQAEKAQGTVILNFRSRP